VLLELANIDATMPIHIHIAEQEKEVNECIEWSGMRPVQWLLDNFNVDQHWCLVHATHMDESETVAFAQSGAIAGICPTTEANLGDGLFNFKQFIENGGGFGIGSNVGDYLYRHALKGGERALGLKVGKIAPGYLANFSFIKNEIKEKVLGDKNRLLDKLIFSSGPSSFLI
jgi:formimidoylglutamate deiminase